MAVERAPRSLLGLPHALTDDSAADLLAERLGRRRPVVFLDYDGTLTPIVDDPAAATLDPVVRQAVADLAAVVSVAVVSGRDRADVEALVGIDGLVYAGSHGFDIAGPGLAFQHPGGQEARASLAAAADDLDQALADIDGAIVERKAFAVAVHFRMVDPHLVPVIDAAVDAALAAHPGLRRTTGKMIFELRPAIEWDKGRALAFLLDRILPRSEGPEGEGSKGQGFGPDTVAVYVGDDDTDEDALAVVAAEGLGVIVGIDDRPTWAHLRLSDPREVAELLARLTSREVARTTDET